MILFHACCSPCILPLPFSQMRKRRLEGPCLMAITPPAVSMQASAQEDPPQALVGVVLGLLTLPQPSSSSLRCHCPLSCRHHQARKTCWAGQAAASIRPHLVVEAFVTAQRPGPAPRPPGEVAVGVTHRDRHTHGCGERDPHVKSLWQSGEGEDPPPERGRTPPNTHTLRYDGDGHTGQDTRTNLLWGTCPFPVSSSVLYSLILLCDQGILHSG